MCLHHLHHLDHLPCKRLKSLSKLVKLCIEQEDLARKVFRITKQEVSVRIKGIWITKQEVLARSAILRMVELRKFD